MACNFNIKVVEQNDFTICIPLKKRTFVASTPIDEDIDILALEDLSVKIGGAVFPATRDVAGVMVDVSRDALARGTYDVVLTATYKSHAIKAAYFDSLTIVEWNCQSDAQQCVQGSPIMFEAAFVIYNLTDAELVALKEEFRLKIAAAERAKEEAEEAKEEYIAKAEAIDDVAKQTTLVQGVGAIREDISHIDIDTSTLAKEVQVKDGNDTAISVGKEIRSEVGTGSDTAAETGTLFAVVKWVKDKVKSIYNALTDSTYGLAAIVSEIGQIALNAQTLQSLADSWAEMVTHKNSLLGRYVFSDYTVAENVSDILSKSGELIEIDDDSIVTMPTNGNVFACTNPNNVFPKLKVLRLKNFNDHNTNYFCSGFSALEELDIRSCVNVASLTQLGAGCINLKKLNVLSATGFPQNYYFLNNTVNMIDVITGRNFTNGSGVRMWNPTNALDAASSSLVEEGEPFANNCEKLLYNIREHIAANLVDRTGSTSWSIVFTNEIKAAIQADTATSNAFTNKNWTIA